MHEFVQYVNTHNNKDIDEDGALNNLVDENYYKIKAIKKDKALLLFQRNKGYLDIEVANAYRDAVSFDFIKDVDHEGIGIVLTDKGRHFIETGVFDWKTGKWNEVVKYYGSWSIALSTVAIVISIVALVVTYRHYNS